MVQDPSLIRLEDLKWLSYVVPDSEPAVRLARFHVNPDTRAFSVLVRFEAGWARPTSGYYESVEEILVLEGGFTMSGESYNSGDYGWFPAGYGRQSSISPGALVWAWFSGPARWHRSDKSPSDFDPTQVVTCVSSQRPIQVSPLGGQARLLREGPDWSSWLTSPGPVKLDASAGELEVFSIPTSSFAIIPASAEFTLDGPCFVRQRHGRSTRDNPPAPGGTRVKDRPAVELAAAAELPRDKNNLDHPSGVACR